MALSCNNATESLFQIEFPFSQASEKFYFNYRSINANATTIIESQELQKYEKVSNVSACLPTDGCYTAYMHNLDTDMFKFIWKGEELSGEQVRQFPTDDTSASRPEPLLTFAEFGEGCVPECTEEESLFELVFFEGEFNRPLWRLEDDVGNEIVGCNDIFCGGRSYGYGYNVGTHHSCIPKSDCSRFIFGGADVQHYDQGLNALFEVKVDGEVVAQEQNVDFSVVDIGTCTDPCKVDESPFEFFLDKQKD